MSTTAKESKIAATERLRREGRWNKAWQHRHPRRCHVFDASTPA